MDEYGMSIADVQFSPDGTKIVSCGYDKAIKVWDSGQPLTPRPSRARR